MIGPILLALWFVRKLSASARLVASCGLALVLVVASASGAEEVPRSRAQIALSFAPVVRAAAPAVVNIYTRKQQQRRSAANPFSSDPFFRFFFPEFGGPLPNDVPENALGSGVIVDAGGLIVTNHHVIEDAEEIMVVLSDRREFRAELVGADEAADLALLDVEADGLPALPMGDSDLLEVGDLEGRHPLAGATVANLSPGLNRDLGLDLFEAGVIVLKVDPASPAAQLRLRRGDLIRTIAEQPIDYVAELKTALRESQLPWRLEVERAGRRFAVVIGA